MSTVDKDKDGSLSYEEFRQSLEGKMEISEQWGGEGGAQREWCLDEPIDYVLECFVGIMELNHELDIKLSILPKKQ